MLRRVVEYERCVQSGGSVSYMDLTSHWFVSKVT